MQHDPEMVRERVTGGGLLFQAGHLIPERKPAARAQPCWGRGIKHALSLSQVPIITVPTHSPTRRQVWWRLWHQEGPSEVCRGAPAGGWVFLIAFGCTDGDVGHVTVLHSGAPPPDGHPPDITTQRPSCVATDTSMLITTPHLLPPLTT